LLSKFSRNIRQLLEKNELLNRFKAIVGYDDIPSNMQKPLGFGGLKCINQIFKNPTNKVILYIGDHEGDVEFARNIAKELHQSNQVISITVTYSGANTQSWSFKPDFEISSPAQLLKLVD
jgi:N-acetyl-D-muramate 6-phosphate phosphatase